MTITTKQLDQILSDLGHAFSVAEMRRILRAALAAGMLLFLSVPTSAQTGHPCDETTPTSGKIEAGGAYAFWCSKSADEIDAVTVVRDGERVVLSPLERLTPNLNSAGEALYRVHLGMVPAGEYTYHLAVWNKSVNEAPQEGPLSDPFVLSVLTQIPVPGRPTRVRVERSPIG